MPGLKKKTLRYLFIPNKF